MGKKKLTTDMHRKFNKWYVDFCNYYQAEEEDPFYDELAKVSEQFDEHRYSDIRQQTLFWNIERVWCNKVEDWDMPLSICECYIESGLENFSLEDGVPMTLKAMLYNKIESYCGSANIDCFKDFYIKKYLGLRIPRKRLTPGKRILNQYRLELNQFCSSKKNFEDESVEQHHMFEIVNAVDAIFGFDKPISESKMCNFIAHAKKHNMQIEIVPDYESMHVSFGQSFHPEYKEIRALVLSYLENQSERFDDAEYVGRWEGFYVYAHASDSGVNQDLQFPVYYIVKGGKVMKVQDYRCIEISKRVRR